MADAVVRVQNNRAVVSAPGVPANLLAGAQAAALEAEAARAAAEAERLKAEEARNEAVEAAESLVIVNRTAASAAPAFVYMPYGLTTGTPDNLRTGLSTDVYPEGGFLEELTLSVTGTKGAKILACAETTKVAGLGSSPWACALIAADRSGAWLNTVMGHNGSNQIYLDAPLEADLVGELTARFDQAGSSGIHWTKGASWAAGWIMGQTPASRTVLGRELFGTSHLTPPSRDMLWSLNAALIAYGPQNSAPPIVQTLLFKDARPGGMRGGSVGVVPLNAACGVRFGTHVAGHGAVARLNFRRKAAMVPLFVSAARGSDPASAPLTGVQISVRLTAADGTILYDAVQAQVITPHFLPVSDVDGATLEVKNLDGGIYEIAVSQMRGREVGPGGRLIAQKSVGVVFFDSYGKHNDSAFVAGLEAATGATIYNLSKPGMTVEYFHSWFDAVVAPMKPDWVAVDTAINDYSYAYGAPMQQFETPSGAMADLWPSGAVGAGPGKAHWKARIGEIFGRIAAIGAQPIYMHQGGLASEASTPILADWFWSLDESGPSDDYIAPAAALTDPASFVNTHGKFAGRPILSGGRTLFAEGPLPADAWRNRADEALLKMQAVTLEISDYNAPHGFQIGLDDVADGPPLNNAVGDGRSNKTSIVGFGAQTGDTYTYSVPSGRQRLSATYGSSSGNQRVGYPFTLISGVDYLLVATVVGATANQALNVYTNLTSTPGGTNVTVANGNNQVDAAGNATVWFRGVAGDAGDGTGMTKTLAIGNERVNGQTRVHDVSKVVCVNLATLFTDAPNLASLSNAELVAFVTKLL